MKEGLMKISALYDPRLLLENLYAHRRLIARMTRRQLAARYRGSMLGCFWSLSHPLMMLAVYTFVFGIVFRTRWGLETDSTGSFAVIMFCGMAVFNIFSETVNASARVVTDNANFVKKVVFPLEILPIVQLLSTLVLGMIWFGLVLAGALALGLPLSWTFLLLPFVLLPLALCTLGVSYFTASITVYCRDMPHLTGIATQILFFLTPVFYPAHLVPGSLRWVLHINPLTGFVTQAREVLLFGIVPDWRVYVLLLALSWTVCHVGLVWFLKTKKGFADVL